MLMGAVLLLLQGCTSKPQIVPPATDHFPPEISKIIVTRCATSGCHNAASYQNAGGLLLDSWEHLFDGGVNGAAVVAFSPDYSPLLYFINTDSTRGTVAAPMMPLNNTPLTAAEYELIRNWIAAGAPDKDGHIPFASDAAERQKVYVVHQGCDMVGVVDAEKNVVMRYIPVGTKSYPEALSYVRVSPDGNDAYLCFWYSDEVYRVDTRTDQVIQKFRLDNSFWGMMHIARDGRKLVLTNGDDHSLAVINTTDGTISYHKTGELINPLGITSNPAFDTFYVTSQYGNTLYKVSAGSTRKISIDGLALTTASGATPDPCGIQMSPDHSRYFIACAKSAEIRVFRRSDDQLLKVIPVGVQPAEIAISGTKPYLFVACTEDKNGSGSFKGSVYVIDYNTLDVVSRIEGDFFQPYSVAVNDRDNTFYVFNRNQDYDGPAPHHQGPCSGRNGYYNVYDLNTLLPRTRKRYEVLVDPYVSAPRFGQ